MKEYNTYPSNLIKIGENPKDNDELVSKSKQNDVWFHLDSLPSCHVVIASSKQNTVTKEMIRYCAILCKEHTKYRNNNKLKIIYTKIKNVKRTNVSGQVIIKGKCDTIII